MFCKYCGNQLVEGSAFCDKCGEPVEKAPVVEENVENVKETVVEEPAVVAEETAVIGELTAAEESVAVEENGFAQPQFDAPVKKKKKGLGLLVSVIAALLACVVVVGAFFEPLKGFAIKTIGSEEDYLEFVATKSTETATEEIAKFYGSFLKTMDSGAKQGSANKVMLTLNASDKAIDLLEEASGDAIGQKLDLAWLKSISLEMNTNIKEKAMQLALALKLNDKELANAELIMDLVKQEAFVGIPSLTEKYLKTEITGDEAFDTLMNASAADLKAALPSEEIVKTLLDKYIAVILEQVDDVDKSTETVEIDDISQKLTVMKIAIDYDMMKAIATNLLETADADEQLAKIIKDFAAYLEENEYIDDADEIYDDFKDGIEQALDEIKDDESEDDFETIRLTIYVDNAHECVGYKVKVDETTAQVLTVRDGKKFAYEMKSEGIKITGTGTEAKDVMNGKFTFKQNDMKLLELTCTDVTEKDEEWSGKFLFTPSDELLESMGLDSMGASVVSLASPQIELIVDSKQDSPKLEVNLLTGKDLLVGLALSADSVKVSDIESPKSGDVYTQEQLNEWLQTLDMENLMKNLENASVPKDLLEGLLGG